LDLLQNQRGDLTERDWRLLSNILNAYENFSTLPYARDLIKQSSIVHLPKVAMQSAIIDHEMAAMRSFFSSIPDFQILTVSEQCSLLERNGQVVTCVSFSSVVRDSGFVYGSEIIDDAIKTYGVELTYRAGRLRSRLDLDSTLIKLMLVVHAFSASCLIMDAPRSKQNDTLTLGTFRLLGSQNVYAELVWKYMIYRYGYREAVLRVASLVKQMLDISSHLADCYSSSEVYRQFVEETCCENKRSMSRNSNSYAPLWGNV
jgi:hypothetical protein